MLSVLRVVRPSSYNVVVNCVWTRDVCCGTTQLGGVTNYCQLNIIELPLENASR